ncbi:hypothetical protein PSJ8397_02179 [Pseudooctadecabacter jejudonensis]|uniref:Uncharacterized protein n=1 Tax=Pseudooctadecabacter jejudonensis TaxID=1391910 RepID=A0A1Y5SKE9_9RHOB|nr:hypothetical protein PSJ8397_02179 [Pseudooctadecabacter jejudonensis]
MWGVSARTQGAKRPWGVLGYERSETVWCMDQPSGWIGMIRGDGEDLSVDLLSPLLFEIQCMNQSVMNLVYFYLTKASCWVETPEPPLIGLANFEPNN